MGFRTTIISETKYIAWPDWFVKQYDGVLTVGGRGLSSLVECKVDFLVDEVFTDTQKCLSAEQSLLVLMLHECGGVTRCTIEKEKITYIEPSEYVEVNEPTHPVYECHGCTKHLTPPARWIPVEPGGEALGDVIVTDGEFVCLFGVLSKRMGLRLSFTCLSWHSLYAVTRPAKGELKNDD